MTRETKGFLIYLFGFVGGLVTLAVVQKDPLLRFHGAQSIILTLPLTLLIALYRFFIAVFARIPIIGWMISVGLGMFISLISLVGVLLWLLCMIRCLQGQHWHIPLLGRLAERHVMHWFFRG